MNTIRQDIQRTIMYNNANRLRLIEKRLTELEAKFENWNNMHGKQSCSTDQLRGDADGELGDSGSVS